MSRIQRKVTAYSKMSKKMERKLEIEARKPMPKLNTKRSLESLAIWCKANRMTYGTWFQMAYKQYCDEKRDKKCKDM